MIWDRQAPTAHEVSFFEWSSVKSLNEVMRAEVNSNFVTIIQIVWSTHAVSDIPGHDPKFQPDQTLCLVHLWSARHPDRDN